MQLIEIKYRFPEWSKNRPDGVDQVPDTQQQELIDEVKALGGEITGCRVIGWREQLAAMESNPE